MLALTSATGKLGNAVLRAVLEQGVLDEKELVVCTSSDPSSQRLAHLHARGLTIRQANYSDPASLRAAYTGCTALFLVSTPAIAMDYNNAPLWSGREAHHRAAIDAAIAVGVRHIYYTSLAFGRPSRASVMRAHIRTEEYLEALQAAGKIDATVLREGLYNQSWPLYFGYYFSLRGDARSEVLVAGDGPVSWTSIADMAFATARVLGEPRDRWAGRTVYLAQKATRTLADIARIVSEVQGRDVRLKLVSRAEYEEHYVREMAMDKAAVEWWSSTYEALEQGECAIEDPTLEDMLREAGRRPVPLEETVKEMMMK